MFIHVLPITLQFYTKGHAQEKRGNCKIVRIHKSSMAVIAKTTE